MTGFYRFVAGGDVLVVPAEPVVAGGAPADGRLVVAEEFARLFSAVSVWLPLRPKAKMATMTASARNPPTIQPA
jgi:hypothetical protein